MSPPTHDSCNIDEDDKDDDDFVSLPAPSTSRRKGAIPHWSRNGTKTKKVKKVDNGQRTLTTNSVQPTSITNNVQPTSTTTTANQPTSTTATAKGSNTAPPTNKRLRTAPSNMGTTSKEEKNLSKDTKVQTCPTCIRNGESGPFDHSRSSSKRCRYYKARRAAKVSFKPVAEGGGGGGAEGFLGGARERFQVATVVMGQIRFWRAAQLAEAIENTVKEMTQLIVEGNAVLLRFVLHRLEAGDEIPSLWGSNLARQCFAATQQMSVSQPYLPRTDPHCDPEVLHRRDEYREQRPHGLCWADGR
ncbi:hypothetical protein HK104_001318 [Borealophlyctis nickersoniae]|nr:hypothetical protein HK104_001318 [Borealophlyctis nickersoniae]